ncbi:MAG: hypothetical protein ACRD21_00575 [Vicinamibacteria bacterium]
MKRRRALAACLLALAYVSLTFLFTYPLAFHLGTHHVGEARGDAKVYLWNYWWTEKALTELQVSPFETDAIFHPIGIGLAFHTLAFLQGVEYALFGVFTSDVVASNLVLLATFVASALATYALAREVGARATGSFLAGVVFAFCPYRLARLSGHYDLLGTEWIPLYVLALWKLAQKDRFSPSLALGAGAAAAACGYTASTYLAFLALFTLLFLGFHARRLRDLAPRVAAVGAVALLLLAPLLRQASIDWRSWTYEDYPGADRYVADLGSYLMRRSFDDNLTETTVFAGYLVTAFAIAGIALRKRIEGIFFWLVSALAFSVLSLGSSLHVGGRDTGLPLPFALVASSPILDQLRAPSRFSILTMLALAVVFALVWTHAARRRRFDWLAAAFASALLVGEYLTAPIPLFAAETHPVYRDLQQVEGRLTVVEIPGIEQAPVETMYHQTIHEKPIFVGTAARVPREKSEYYLGLPLVRPLIDLRKGKIELGPELVAEERKTAPAVARFLGIGYFVIDRGYERRGVVSYLEQVLPVERWYEDERLVVLRTRREELPPDPHALDADAPESRQHFESGWLRAERDEEGGFRWAHRERSTILFRRPSSSVDLVVVEAAPLEGLRLSVRAGLDGRRLGVRELEPGWRELLFPLPPPRAEGAVERLSLHWSSLRAASERDPRRVAARVRAIRFLNSPLSER